MTCPRCNGYIWTESDRALLESWREHILRYGFEIVCIAGHRDRITPDECARILKAKKEKKNVSEKDRCNQRRTGRY